MEISREDLSQRLTKFTIAEIAEQYVPASNSSINLPRHQEKKLGRFAILCWRLCRESLKHMGFGENSEKNH